MSQGSRPNRVADQIRGELAQLIARDVHDPGIGFVTFTRVHVSPDLQQARVYYTALGDAKSLQNTARARTGRAVSAPSARIASAPEAHARTAVPLRRIDRRAGSDRAAAQRAQKPAAFPRR
jgi:hypothetical protein